MNKKNSKKTKSTVYGRNINDAFKVYNSKVSYKRRLDDEMNNPLGKILDKINNGNEGR